VLFVSWTGLASILWHAAASSGSGQWILARQWSKIPGMCNSYL